MVLNASDERVLLVRFSEMARGLLSARSGKDAIAQLIAFVEAYFRAESWSLLLYNRKRASLRFLHAAGPGALELSNKDIPADRGIAGWVAGSKTSILVPNAYDDPRFDPTCDRASGFVTKSIIATPLMVEGVVIGVLELINNLDEEKGFGPRDLFLLETLAEFAATAMDRLRHLRKLRRQAFRDPLTGVANRRTFNATLRRQIQSCVEQKTLFALLLVDVDSFKSINDSYGHPTGDRVLIRVARILRESVRSGDLVARVGGDEFALLLPSIGDEEADRVKKRITELVSRNSVCRIHFRLSVGMQMVDPLQPWRIFEATDRVLYRSKHSRLSSGGPG